MTQSVAPNLDAIQQALLAAQAAAAQVASSAPAAPVAPAPSTGTGLAPTAGTALARPTPGKPIGLKEAMANRGVAVDLWLKVGYHGITVGKEKDLISEIVGVIDIPQVKFFYGVRYGGSNPIYDHTYDGVVSAKSGKPWADVMAQAYRVEANNEKFKGEYPGVELVIVPQQDITNAKGDKVLARAGKRLGFSTSIMNFRDWEAFYADLVSKGLEDSKVLITLGYEASEYNGKWGKWTFGEPAAVN